MKAIYHSINIALLSGLFVLNSCSDDFLQRDSLTAVSSATFWQTESDALNGLAACYDGLQNGFLYNDGNGDKWNGCGPLNMDAMTDNGGRFNWNGWMPGYDICNGIHSSSSHLIEQYWKANYEVIKRCNTLLTNIDRVQMDASQVAIYKAEAVVIRSLMYLNLTMTYQDVPYIKSVQSLTNAEIEKTDRATIVTDVMADLKNAAKVLPKEAAERGHVTQGAALSLLGRLALYNQQWDEAIRAYEAVTALGYELYPDYSTLFTEANEACSEVIWGIRYEGPAVNEGSSLGGHWDAPQEALNATVDLADAFYRTDGTPNDIKEVCAYNADGSADLWTLNTDRYLNRDPRLKATLFLPGMAWGKKDWYYGGAAASYSTLYVMKYFNPALNSQNSWDSGQDFYLIRYAEVLLSLAEAYIEKGGGKETDAITLIDKVRARVGMPKVEEVEGTSPSQTQLREIVRHERRVELAFEGLRLFDLYRWGILQEAVDKINAEAAYYSFWYEKRNFRGKQEYIWPIPQTEIDSNKKLEQNSLWK